MSENKQTNNQIYDKKNLDKNKNNIFNPKASNNKKNNIKVFDEEINKKKEEEEKNKIRDKLQCYICYGKIINATMCSKCKAMACEECVKKMLSKEKVCSNCKKNVSENDMIKLPFMDDLTLFFINNVESKRNSIKKNNQNNLSNDNKTNKNFSEDTFKDIKCKYHNDTNVEYYCFNCNVYLCSKCLMVSNRENVAKHKTHIILSNEQIKEFNLNNIIKEYKKLSDFNLNLDNQILDFELLSEERKANQILMNEIINAIKSKIEGNYKKKINSIKYILNILKSKKKEIGNQIETFKNFEEIINDNDIKKSKEFLNMLRQLNNYPNNKEEIIEKTIFQKNICCESFKSEIIEFEMPNNGEYLEGLQIFEKKLNFIPNTPLKVSLNLLINKIMITIAISTNEFYEKHNTIFYGYLIFLSKKKGYYIILNSFYKKNESILTEGIDFSRILSLLDENHKCKIKFHIIRNYYK